MHTDLAHPIVLRSLHPACDFVPPRVSALGFDISGKRREYLVEENLERLTRSSFFTLKLTYQSDITDRLKLFTLIQP